MNYIVKQLPHVWGLIYFLFLKNHNIVSFLLEKKKEKRKREVIKSKRLDEM